MKKLLIAIILLVMSVSVAQAQPDRGPGHRPEHGPGPDRGPGHGRGHERIHAAKMAYITDRLHLSSNQAAGFTPLYNEYEADVRATRQAFFSKYNGTRPEDADDATSRQWLDDNLDYQQQIIELKRKYNDRFIKIISPQQLAELYKAEREFNQMLMQRLRQNRNGGDGRFNRGNR